MTTETFRSKNYKRTATVERGGALRSRLHKLTRTKTSKYRSTVKESYHDTKPEAMKLAREWVG